MITNTNPTNTKKKHIMIIARDKTHNEKQKLSKMIFMVRLFVREADRLIL